MATRELSEEVGGSSGNYGILDQQEALRWVQVGGGAGLGLGARGEGGYCTAAEAG